MRPKKHETTGSGDLFRAQLELSPVFHAIWSLNGPKRAVRNRRSKPLASFKNAQAPLVAHNRSQIVVVMQSASVGHA